MITFKEYLLEKALNRGVYLDVIKKLAGKALVGLEIEARVPPESPSFRLTKPADRRTEDVREYSTLADFSESFLISPTVLRQITGDFAGWSAAQEDDWVEDNWESYIDADEVEASGDARAEKTARRAALGDHKSADHGWSEWFTTFKNVTDFLDIYELEPKHGWVEDNKFLVYMALDAADTADSSWESTANHFGALMSAAIGDKVTVKDAPGADYSSWKIVPDTSITNGGLGTNTDGDLTGVGIELVSPPLPVDTAIDQLTTIFKLMTDQGLDTNTSTGIHINISVPELAKNLDPLKLVLFMGDEHVLKVFDRSANLFTRSQISSIIDGIQITGTVPSTGAELMDAARQSLSQAKYRSVNLGHVEKGYLEFRASGGVNYHKKLDLIVDTIGRWLTVVDIATDPALLRNEYLKKVAKLLGRTSAEKDKAQHSDVSLKELVISTARNKEDGESLWIDLQQRSVVGFDALAKFAINVARSSISKPSVKQIMDVKNLFKTLSVTVADMVEQDPDVEVLFNRFAEMFKLQK